MLQALATTIKRDPTAAHYKFHDDPYLIPVSNATKRMYALSQESGRKTAMWILEKHPELFQSREADPPIEVRIFLFGTFAFWRVSSVNCGVFRQAFYPKFVYDETDVLDNDILEKLILSSSVSDAIHVYKLMEKTGVGKCRIILRSRIRTLIENFSRRQMLRPKTNKVY